MLFSSFLRGASCPKSPRAPPLPATLFMRLTGKDVKREQRGRRAYSPRVSETGVYFRKRLHTQGPRKSTIHASAATIQAAESQGAEETATEIEITTKKTRATILDNAMIAGQFRDERWSDCGGLEAW
jgi:hypothetical protein